MSIIAHAKVPAQNRLIDAPTLGITAIRRPSPWPANAPRQTAAADLRLIERAKLADPVRFRQLVEAVELGGVEALARKWGVFPEGGAR